MPTPKKGPRFGRDPAHQRLIMANLAASLFAAEAIVTTEAKAKVLRPYAEKLITKAKKGGVHDRRQVIATIHDQDVTHKLFADIAPRYTEPSGWVPAHPQARSPPGRQRAHGARRTGVTLFEPATARSQRRRALERTSRSSSRTTAPTSTASPRNRASAPSRACSSRRSSTSLRGDVDDFACAGRTDAGVHAWGQVVSLSTAAEIEPDQLAHALTKRLGPEIVVRSARGRRRRLRRPPLGGGPYVPLHGGEPARARPVPRPVRVVGARAARARPPPARRRPVRRRARLRRVLPQGPRGLHHRAGGSCGRTGTSSATASCATRSGPPRSAGRWCARSSARSSRSARAAARRATSWASSAPATGRRPGRLAPPQGLCLWEVDYPGLRHHPLALRVCRGPFRPGVPRSEFGIWNAHVLAQGRRHHPHLARPRRRGPGAGPARHRGRHAAAGQAQAHVGAALRRRRPRRS